MKKLNFSNIEEYENYLNDVFPKLAEDMEYNIFIHCVTCNTNYFCERPASPEVEIGLKVDGIMKHGLNLDGAQGYGNYGSINGTARFLGNSRHVDVSRISQYDFFSRSKNVNSIIIAIPKYIKVFGKQVEFSSYKGVMKNCSQHIKDCLYDLVKGYYLPVEFILGHQIVNQGTGAVTLNLNEKHLSLLEVHEKLKLLNSMTQKSEHVINYCKNRYGVEDYEEIFKVMTEEHMFAISDFLNEP